MKIMVFSLFVSFQYGWTSSWCLYFHVGFCCAASPCYVRVCSSACVCVHSLTAVLTAGAKLLKESTQHKAAMRFECKSQCLCKLGFVCVCVGQNLPGCSQARHCAFSSMWAIARGRHGSGIPLIMTAAWRNRLPFTAAVTESHILFDKPRQQI